MQMNTSLHWFVCAFKKKNPIQEHIGVLDKNKSIITKIKLANHPI